MFLKIATWPIARWCQTHESSRCWKTLSIALVCKHGKNCLSLIWAGNGGGGIGSKQMGVNSSCPSLLRCYEKTNKLVLIISASEQEERFDFEESRRFFFCCCCRVYLISSKPELRPDVSRQINICCKICLFRNPCFRFWFKFRTQTFSSKTKWSSKYKNYVWGSH